MLAGTAKRRGAIDLFERVRNYFSPRERVDTSPKVSDTVKTTTCYMCACRCGIRVHLKDGAIRYIEGNRDHPVNRGVICGKGAAGIMQQHSPAKLTKPPIRIGERARSSRRRCIGSGSPPISIRCRSGTCGSRRLASIARRFLCTR